MSRAKQKAKFAIRMLRDALEAAEGCIDADMPIDNAMGALVTGCGNVLTALGRLDEERHQRRLAEDPEYAARFA